MPTPEEQVPMFSPPAWYLVRTKSCRERYVHEQLSRVVPDLFLPLLRMRSGRSPVPSTVPLFPQYIFARLDLAAHFFEVRYMPGVVGFVSAGQEPLAVSETIVDSVRSRCRDGVVELNPRRFTEGEHVRVVGGPFRDFDAIFQGYLSGSKRVAILIQTVEGTGVRVLADASIIASQTSALY
jgi:transcription antitermination factor NusG